MYYHNLKRPAESWSTTLVNGIPLPYRPEEGEWVLERREDADGRLTQQWTLREKLPADVRAFQSGLTKAGQIHAYRDALIDLAKGMAIEVPGYQCVLMGSAEIPRGHCYFDQDGFYRNEDECLEAAQDFDGDQGHVHFREEHAVWTKFPGTLRSQPLVKLAEMPKEEFLPLPWEVLKERIEAEQAVVYDELEQFAKTAAPNETGLVTWEWNTKEFYECQDMPTLKSRLYHLFSDPGRRQAVEGGLKDRSKDKNTFKAQEVRTLDRPVTLTDEMNWAMYPNRIGSLRMDQLAWLGNADLKDTITRILNLELDFRDILASEGEDEQVMPMIYDRDLLSRLYSLKLVDYRELPKIREELPPAIIFWLRRPDVKFCGLTDTKRGVNFRTYCYVVPPVAKKVRGQWQIVHPLTAIADRLAEFDCFVRHPESGDVTRLFPQHARDLEYYEGKRAGLQRWIQKILGEYGDCCPARLIRGELVPTNTARGTATRTIAVDYGPGKIGLEAKKEMIQEINQITRIAIAGGKGSSERVRKFALARANGTPLWAKPWDHPRRAANQRAQLIQAIPPKDDQKFKVAIVQMRTKTQAMITPSGIAKQRTEEVFLPRVSSLAKEGFDKEERRTAWDGRTCLSFVGSARATREIGKLVDFHGMKFVPRRAEQAYLPDGTPIDLIVPVDEVEAKACLQTWLEGAEFVQEITMGDQVFEGWVADRLLFRTGTASENIPVTKRVMRLKGADRLLVHSELLELHPEMEDKEFTGLPFPDLSYAQAKIEAVTAILAAAASDPNAPSAD